MGIEFAEIAIAAIDPNYTEESETNKFIICHIALPFRIPLRETSFEIKVQNEVVSVHLQTHKSGEIEAGNHVFDFDRYGQITKTSVKVKFKKDRKCNIVLTNSVALIYFKKSVEVINRLLKACAIYGEIYCNRKIVFKDILNFSIFCEDKVKHIVNPFSDKSNTSFRLLENSKNSKEIRNFLLNGDEIPLYEELIINAKDYFLIENYRMASIEIQTGVEYSIAKYLRKVLEKKNLSEQSIQEILRYRLDDLTKQITTCDSTITNNKIWSDWKSMCYLLRNKIIHQSYFPNESETSKAIQSGENLIRLLVQRLATIQ